MKMARGMKMACRRRARATPTAAQQAATVKLVNTSWRDAQKFRSLAAAKAAGYVPITPTGLPVVHYLNLKSYEATAEGGPVHHPGAAGVTGLREHPEGCRAGGVDVSVAARHRRTRRSPAAA